MQRSRDEYPKKIRLATSRLGRKTRNRPVPADFIDLLLNQDNLNVQVPALFDKICIQDDAS